MVHELIWCHIGHQSRPVIESTKPTNFRCTLKATCILSLLTLQRSVYVNSLISIFTFACHHFSFAFSYRFMRAIPFLIGLYSGFMICPRHMMQSSFCRPLLSQRLPANGQATVQAIVRCIYAADNFRQLWRLNMCLIWRTLCVLGHIVWRPHNPTMHIDAACCEGRGGIRILTLF